MNKPSLQSRLATVSAARSNSHYSFAAPALRALSHALAALLALPATAAVPHRWQVESSRVQIEPIEAFRGEQIDLQASFNAYGSPLELPSSASYSLYWQTNGMGSAYWVTNATLAASNLLSAAFLPEFAPAAPLVRGFIGSPDSSYRAAFTIRFRDAPGATPNVLPLPTQTLDFAKITVSNPPYYSKDETDAKISAATPADYANVANLASNAAPKSALSDYAKSADLAAESSARENEDNTIKSGITSHVSDRDNPHNVTPAQIGAATTDDLKATKAVVYTWEEFLDGSNVVFSITNYISGSYNIDTAKLRILELKDGEYREVYNSRDEILAHLDHFRTNEFATATNSVISEVDSKVADKADRAWGKYTSAGSDAPSNTVWMTAPSTVFAGGMEYQRVAVGEGAVCFLVDRGAPVRTQGDEGVFKFQDDGGTNYFGFAKTDSYTIGADADGIDVSTDSLVTLTYSISMNSVPCVWYKAALDDGIDWVQLNLPDGSATEGAPVAVSWDDSPPAGKQVCYVNCSGLPSGFFKATVEVAGSAKFITNMPADLSAGIICTNTATGVNGVIAPIYNGTGVSWTWKEIAK